MKKNLAILSLLTGMLFGPAQADILLNETFSAGSPPAGWTTTALAGAATWTFSNVQTFGTGGRYAVFDDNALGAAVTPNRSELVTPTLNFTGRTNAFLRFDHYWFGVENTWARVEISINGGAWSTLTEYNNFTQGSLATPSTVTLEVTAQAANQANVRFRFVFSDNNQAGRYWYLDNVIAFSGPDVGVTTLVSPAPLNNCVVNYTATQAVTVRIQNFSTDPVTLVNLPVTVNVTGAGTFTLNGTYSGTLAPGATVDYTLPGTINMTTMGTYVFAASTGLATDAYLANNGISVSRSTRINTFPFTENFNSGDGGWTPISTQPTRNWVYGALPGTYAVDGPEGQGNSWRLVMTSGTGGGGPQEPILETPYFDFSNPIYSNLVIGFDLKTNFNSNGGWNYVAVEYSINGGTSWTRLGGVNDPTWYNFRPNNPSYAAFGAPSGQTLTVGNWTRVERNLCPVVGQPCVKFRFSLIWPNGGQPAEFAIDNFTVTNTTPDVMVSQILQPLNTTNAGCGYSATTPVQVRVWNLRCAPVTNVPVRIDAVGPNNATLTDVVPSIPANSFVDFTFAGTLNLTGVGSFNLKAYTQLAGDVNTANDTTITNLAVAVPTISTFPYTEDFNANNGFWIGQSNGPTWEWRWGPLPATYAVDGPDGQGSSWYVNGVTPSNGSIGTTYISLMSPIFDISKLNDPEIRFDVKMNVNPSGGWNRFYLQYSIDGGTNWTTMPEVATPPTLYTTGTRHPNYTTTGWGQANVGDWVRVTTRNLCAINNQSCVRLRIMTEWFGNGGNAPREFALDNFFLGDPRPYDLELVNIQSPNTGNCTNPGTQNVTIVVYNDACVDLKNVPVQVDITGPVTTTLTGTIATLGRKSRATFTFPTAVNFTAAGTYTLTANISLPVGAPPLTPETNAANNTLVHTRMSGKINTIPYFEDFNATNGAFAPAPNDANHMWRWGALPASYTVDGPEGQGNSWRLALFSGTGGGGPGTPWIETPLFDLTGITNPVLSFDLKALMSSAGGWNYVAVQYSTNGGTSWTNLGAATDPTWYGFRPNNPSYAAFGAPSGQTLTIGDWTRVERNLCPIANNACVKFRIAMIWPNAGQPAEFAIDNFRIDNNAPDVMVSAFLKPVTTVTGGCSFTTGSEVQIRVYNLRCGNLTNVPVRVDVAGPIPVSLTDVVPTLNGNSFVDFTFPTTIDLSTVGTYSLKGYTQLVGDINTTNDTARQTVAVSAPIINTFPYSEDFNASNGFWQGQSNSVDWEWRWGALPATYAVDGPDGQGQSWYVNAVTPSNGTIGTTYISLASPIFDFTKLNNPEVRFDVKMNVNPSGGWNRFYFQYSIDGGASWVNVTEDTPGTLYTAGTKHPSYALGWGQANVGNWVNVRVRNFCAIGDQSCVRFRIMTEWFGNGGSTPREFAMDNFFIGDPQPYDLELVNIISPNTGNCTSIGTQGVTIVVASTACMNLTNVPVQVQISGPVNTTLTGIIPTIPRNGRAIYTFTPTVNFSAPGTYTLTATVSLPAGAPPVTPEPNLANNTLVHTRRTGSVTTYPYTQDFNAGNSDFAPSQDNVNHMWRWGGLPATYAVDGPDGQGNSWRLSLFTGTGGGGPGTPMLETPVFDLSSVANPMLAFDLKSNMSSAGGWNYVTVQYSLNGGTSWTTLGAATDPTWYNFRPNNPSYAAFGAPSGQTLTVGDWTRVQRSLCVVNGQTCVKFRFALIWPNAGQPAEFAIDNFSIYTAGNNLAVTNIISPASAAHCSYRNAVPLTVRVYNFSCSPAANVPIQADVTGAIPATLTATIANVPANGFIDYTFPGTLDMTAVGAYNLTVFTDLGSDSDRSNDTSKATINVLYPTISSYPYSENFNANNGGWVPFATINNRVWTHGVLPATYAVDGPEGAGSSWRLNFAPSSGTGGGGPQEPFLYSPIFNLSTVINPVLSFDIKSNISNAGGWNYVAVDYSTNGGTSWTRLGATGDPTWYGIRPNNASYAAWGGPSGGSLVISDWLRVERDLCALKGQNCVQFRFGIIWPNGNQNMQFAVDNVSLTDSPLDATLTTISGCYGSGYDMQVAIRNLLRCPGAATITSANVTVSINGALQTFPLTGLNIAPNGTQTVTLTGLLIPNQSAVVKAWVKMPNGLVDQAVYNDTITANLANFPLCNDHCSNAVNLSIGTTTSSQNTASTPNPAEDPTYASCSSGLPVTLENTVWYSFTTNATGGNLKVTIDNIASSPSNTGIQVEILRVTGPNACNPSDRTSIFCSAPGNTSDIIYGPNNLPPNTRYMIVIDGIAGNNATFDIILEGDAVDPLLPGSIDNIPNSCAGIDPPVFASTTAASGGTPSYFYQWQRGASATGPWTNVGILSTSLTYDPPVENTAGTYYYRRVVQDNNGIGTIAYSNVVIHTVTPAPTANAGADPADFCGTSITLTPVAPAVGSGVWEIVSEPVGSNASVAGNTISGLITGAYQVRWRVTANGCNDATDLLDFDVLDSPVADAGPDQSLCGLTSATLSPTATNGTGVWIVQTNVPGATPAFAGNVVSGLTQAGTYTFRYTVTATSGTCPPVSDDVDVVVSNSPTADAGSNPANFCGTSVTLSPVAPAIGNGAWEITSQPVGSSASVVSSTNTINNLIPGDYTLTWRVTTTTCGDATDDVTFTVLPLPDANAGTDQTLCNTTSATLSPTATNGTGVWTVETAVGGTAPTFAGNVANGLTQPGVYTFRYTVTGLDGTCGSDFDLVDVTISPTPQADAGTPPADFCGSTVTLSPTATNGTGAWSFVTEPAGSLANISGNDITNLIAGIYQLRYTVSANGCSDATEDLSFNVLPLPTGTAGTDQTICEGTNSTTLTPTATNGTGSWAIVRQPAGANMTTNGNTINGLTVNGVYELEWRVSNAVCTDFTDRVLVTREAAPTATASAPAGTICGTSVNLTATATNGSGSWSVVTQPAGANVTFAGNTANGLNVGGNYTFRYTVTGTSPCAAAAADVTVTKEAGSVSFVLLPAELQVPTPNELTVVPYYNVGGIVTYSWTFDGGSPAVYNGDTPPAVIYTVPGTYRVLLEVTTASGCTYQHEQFITVKENRYIPLPNVFSPNNDGLNDLWPGTLDPYPQGVQLSIFNRWGVMVYQGTGPWDGRSNGQPVPEGVYVYVWEMPGYEKRTGNITILR